MALPRKIQYKTYTKDGLKYDRVELSAKYRWIKKELENEVEAELDEFIEYMKSKGRHIKRYQCGNGLCFIYWSIKERIVKEKYNIEWHSPSELNPHVRFD